MSCFVRCSGLNFQDLMARQGAIDSPPKTPFIMGSECAGDIEQVGEGVENFKVSITFNESDYECANLNCKQVCCSKFRVFGILL